MAEEMNMEYAGADDNAHPLHEGEPPQQENSGRKQLIAAVIFILGVILPLYSCLSGGEKRGEVGTRARQVTLAGEALGQYISNMQPQGQVLLITEPEQSPDYHEEIVEGAVKGLERGLGKKIKLAVDAPSFQEDFRREYESTTGKTLPEDKAGKWMPPLEDWFSHRTVLSMLKRHPETALIVSLAGIPNDADMLSAYGVPTMMMLYGARPDAAVLEKAVENGSIGGVVLYEPCVAAEVPAAIESKLKSRFSEQATLVTGDNFNSIKRDCASLLD